MNTESKVLSFERAPSVLTGLRAEGKTIVQCHGTFDLLHPGHVVHFEEAKALGDILVVTITGEEFVSKGPGRPYFNDQLRVKFLAELECVDIVIVVPYPAAVEAIECVKPDFYCKGKEYEDTGSDVTGNILDDVRTAEKLGGQVRYIGSVVFSSTRLLNRHFDTYSRNVKAFCRGLAADCEPEGFRALVDGFADLRVLVVGETIFDRYATVNVQGLTSKNRILSGRFLDEETQAGGALAVLRHLRQFTPHVKLISLVGTEPWVGRSLREYLGPAEDGIVRVPGYTTIVKQRFVEPLNEGKELAKLFSVNYIDARPSGADVDVALHGRLSEEIESYDLVMAMDFGHGMMSDSIRELVQERARFLALNCQTNSNNHGFNLINRRYHRADSFSLDQAEIRLACGRRDLDFAGEIKELCRTFAAKYAWLTRGEVETIGVRQGTDVCSCPPLETNIVDTVGAGDAFCAAASLAAVKGLPLGLATFMGQLAGAEAVRIVGNSKSIEKGKFLKSGQAMLSF